MEMYARIVSATLVASAVAGCATMQDMPQNREQFVAVIKKGGLFTNTETISVARPAKAVAADISQYATSCLNVSFSAAPNMKYQSAGGTTTYRTKMENVSNGVVALSVQSPYQGDPPKGMPAGGIYTFVSEVRSVGANKTDIDFYYVTGTGKMGDFLKLWVNGDKSHCPSFYRAV